MSCRGTTYADFSDHIDRPFTLMGSTPPERAALEQGFKTLAVVIRTEISKLERLMKKAEMFRAGD
jgi:hypothetical protein